jgi:hypothetical protein
MKEMLATLTAIALVVGVSYPAFAEGKHNGFDSDTSTTSGQGSGGDFNPNANPDNDGQTTTTTETTGPAGQLKQGETDCNNCETTTTIDLPGNNR